MGPELEVRSEDNEDIFFNNYFTINEPTPKPRARNERNTLNLQVDAVSVNYDDSDDESQDEATTARLDEAATRYYESVITGLADSVDSEAESTIYDIGNDTQFAFESQEPRNEIREVRKKHNNQITGTTTSGAGGEDNFQLSVNKMDLYLFLTVFTAMIILTSALAYQASMIVIVPASILLYVTLQVAEPKIHNLITFITSTYRSSVKRKKGT